MARYGAGRGFSPFKNPIRSLGGTADVLMDEASVSVSAHDRDRPRLFQRFPRAGDLLCQALMRPRLLVVADILEQHPFEIASAEDQEVIERLPACCSDPSFGKMSSPSVPGRAA